MLVLVVALSGCRSSSSSQASPITTKGNGASRPSSAATTPTSIDPYVPSIVTYATTPGILRGYLYYPAGHGPFPAVIFHHGSEEDPGAKNDQAHFYVAHGFALFLPHRRGQGLSVGAGVNIVQAFRSSGRDPAVLVDHLERQADDAAASVRYVQGLPNIDATRVAVAGCSLGGIEALLLAERDLGIRAAIDFAGAAMTWASSPPLQRRMKEAARGARVPIFFLQAENDFDVAPSRVLADEMNRAGKPMRVHVFPAQGIGPEDGHGFCLAGAGSPPWGDEVLAFLREAMPETH